jgi:hypothetical protein
MADELLPKVAGAANNIGEGETAARRLELRLFAKLLDLQQPE